VGNPKKTVAAMAATVEKQFPQTTHLSIEEYQKNKDEYVLVDVRSEKEVKISKIPGALTRKEFETKRKLYKDKKILTYCTIGVRSSKYVISLKQERFEAYNLKESILGWTHRGLPLIGPEGKETRKVHVYAEAWNLVAKGYKGIWDE
jgi:rhodanese-related sulfurtransferase